jgi:pyrophosphatase PpaX
MPPAPLVCLFDLDGTLIDSIHLILSCYRHTFRTHFGEAPPDDVWIAGIGTPLMTQLRQIVGDEALAQEMGRTYKAFQDAHHDELLREFPGVREVLVTLRERGHIVGVVTSKMRAPALRGLKSAGLADLVEVVVDAESSTKHKPDPEPLLHALRQLGRSPADALYVGDSPHDIMAGRAAGARTIGVSTGPFTRERLAEEQPDTVVAELREILDVVAGWESGRRTLATG